MKKGPDDPLGKKILAAGDPSFDALASYYPRVQILDRTVFQEPTPIPTSL